MDKISIHGVPYWVQKIQGDLKHIKLYAKRDGEGVIFSLQDLRLRSTGLYRALALYLENNVDIGGMTF